MSAPIKYRSRYYLCQIIESKGVCLTNHLIRSGHPSFNFLLSITFTLLGQTSETLTMSKSVFQQHYSDEENSDKLSRKAKDSPFMIFGKLHHIRKNYISKRYTCIFVSKLHVQSGSLCWPWHWNSMYISCCVTYHIFLCLFASLLRNYI